MNGTVAKEQAALKKEGGKLMKFLTMVKKFISKEFLWVLYVLLLALPLGYVLMQLFFKLPTDIRSQIIEWLNTVPLYILTYALAIIGVYFTRMVIGAIKTLTKPKS